ncbi:MAG: SDR family NAD(P)-dependent oxidoreductase, partial [Steroidobacteraceae bacterium]
MTDAPGTLLQLPFYFLPEPLNNFGTMATFSYIDATTPIKDVVGRTLPFPGLSKDNVNLIGYYEKGPFGVRVAYNWRSHYLGSLSGAATGIYNDTYADLSTTLHYDISHHIAFDFEANNLLDEKQRTYDGAEEGLRTDVFFGDVNVIGAVRLLKWCIPEMRARGGGSVVLLSSINAEFATPQLAAYAASKAALNSVMQ